jgi:predicted Zn-dependent protease with MMP-like domain
VREDLEQSQLQTADLPAADDLVAEKPPLSPTILGLFRGLPLSWSGALEGGASAGRAAQGRRPSNTPGGPAASAPDDSDAAGAAVACPSPERTIVLYRQNLLRSVRDLGELDEAIRRTVLHEVGHLRGEDDGSLRDRGLE